MKLRIIAVPVGNEIKSFQMTLGIFFLLGYFADCRQKDVNYDSFEGKVLILL